MMEYTPSAVEITPAHSGNNLETGIIRTPSLTNSSMGPSQQPRNTRRSGFSPTLNYSSVFSPRHTTKYIMSRSWSSRNAPPFVSDQSAALINAVSQVDSIEVSTVDGGDTSSSRGTNNATKNQLAKNMTFLNSSPSGPVQVREHTITEDANGETHSTPFVEFIYSENHSILPLGLDQPEDVNVTEHIIDGVDEEDAAIFFVEFIYYDARAGF